MRAASPRARSSRDPGRGRGAQPDRSRPARRPRAQPVAHRAQERAGRTAPARASRTGRGPRSPTSSASRASRSRRSGRRSAATGSRAWTQELANGSGRRSTRRASSRPIDAIGSGRCPPTQDVRARRGRSARRVTNVVRHSAASHGHASGLAADGDAGRAWRCVDDGGGCEAAGAGGPAAAGTDGTGLQGLRERLERAGGRLDAGRPVRSGGYRVIATIPIPPGPPSRREGAT